MRTMLTQQLVIHRSICQYCTVEQGVVLSSWKRNNSVYYNINIKSGFIQNPKLIQREENFTVFQKTQKAWCCILKEQIFLDSNLYPTDTYMYPPSFQIKKIRYLVIYPFPQIMHIKKVTSCLPIIKSLSHDLKSKLFQILKILKSKSTRQNWVESVLPSATKP